MYPAYDPHGSRKKKICPSSWERSEERRFVFVSILPGMINLKLDRLRMHLNRNRPMGR